MERMAHGTRFRLTTRSRRLVFSILASWSAFAAMLVLGVVFPGPWLRLEGILTDFRHDAWRILFGPDSRSPPATAIVVDIDERTLRALGSYGESYRPHQAKVLDFLVRHGAGAVALDVLFKTSSPSEERIDSMLSDIRAAGGDPGNSSSLRKRLRERLDGTRAIAEVLSDSGRVILSAQLSHPQDYANPSDWMGRANRSWQDSVWPGIAMPPQLLRTLPGRSAMDNLSPLLARAGGIVGLANIEPDPDGTVRRVAMLWRYPDSTFQDTLLGPSGSAIPRAYPGLALRTALVLMGRGEKDWTFGEDRLDLGRPLRIWRDSTGVRTSIPELTWPMCLAIAGRRAGLDSIAKARVGRLEPTSQIWILRDGSGRLQARLQSPDTLDQASLLALAAAADSVLLADVPRPDTVLLSDSVAVVRMARSVEVLRLVSDSLPPLATTIPRQVLSDIVDGIRPLAAAGWPVPRPGRMVRISNWTEVWWNPWRGSLETSLPGLWGTTLEELARIGPDDLARLDRGETLGFGSEVRIPLDGQGAALVPFEAPSVWEGNAPDRSWIRHVSFVDVLEGRLDPALVPGRLFVIGSAATALADFVDIPIQRRYPGVCVQASTTLSLVRGNTLAPISVWIQWSIALLVASVLGAAGVRLSPWGLLGSCLAGVSVVFAASLAAFHHGTWTGLLLPISSLLTGYVSILAVRYVLEERQRRFLHASFRTYISPQLIDRMVESGRLPSLGGEERDITAFFSDIEGFSTISEALSPTDLVRLINEFLSEATRILLDRGGTLDKYIGDAIVAMFGAPVELENHARSALETALAMQGALADLRRKWKNEGSRWPGLVHGMRVRIGIHSGRIVTGNMGSDLRMNYTMMGDDVNLAARLEGACKHYGVWILTTGSTLEKAGGGFVAREIDRVRVVGRREAVSTWEVLGTDDACPESWRRCVEIFTRARALYLSGDFSEARDLFLESEALEPYRHEAKTNPSRVFVQRCEEFTASPPSEFWDGSHTAREK